MEHIPPYSPDLAANDFWMFQKLKSALIGERFHDTEDIKKTVTTAQKSYFTTEVPKYFQ